MSNKVRHGSAWSHLLKKPSVEKIEASWRKQNERMFVMIVAQISHVGRGSVMRVVHGTRLLKFVLLHRQR
jgi:hypothetical protein